jgi:RNA polymerase sigma factor for flagellar operon FliA
MSEPSSTTNPTAAEVTQYLPLVNQVVARFMSKLPPNVLRDDLMAAGTYGLIDSLRKNGSERTATFEWYARIRIRGAILDELRSQDWLTRRARSHVVSAHGVDAGRRSAAVALDDMPSADVASAPSPYDSVCERRQRNALATAVATLPDRERQIITRHYFEDAQFKTIAQELGVSEPRISQLHARAVSMLRVKMAA